jgi:hypothetical protein
MVLVDVFRQAPKQVDLEIGDLSAEGNRGDPQEV